MSKGKINQKRSYGQIEQWMDNEISFPSVPGCQLVDSPIILKALIEGFQLGRTCLRSLRAVSLHHPSNDKVPMDNRQRNHNNENQERNPSGVPGDGRSTRTCPGKKDHPPPDTSL
ncbi:hypothetical protein Tco_0390903 [Tanacetum coccineum]